MKMRVCRFVCVCVYVPYASVRYIRTYIHTYICMNVRTYVRMCVRTYVCAYVRMYALTLCCIHTCVCTRSHPVVPPSLQVLNALCEALQGRPQHLPLEKDCVHRFFNFSSISTVPSMMRLLAKFPEGPCVLSCRILPPAD